MKELKYIILVSLFNVYYSNLEAQNVPDNSSLPGTQGSGTVSYPGSLGAGSHYKNVSRLFIPYTPVTSIPDFDNTKLLPVRVTSVFRDGWDQPIMSVLRNNSTKDIIVPFDNRTQRLQTTYLPYADSFHSRFYTDVFTRQKNYYSSKFPDEGYTAYSKTVVKGVSGQGNIETYKPGKSFIGYERGSVTTSGVNDTSDVFKLIYSSGNICKSGKYSANQLWKLKTDGQHNQSSITFTDKSGRLICKKTFAGGSTWLSTYYVYDDLGRLVCVVPPKATIQLESNTCLSNISDLCYVYDYDDRDRVISKWTPGKTDSDRVIYDRKGRAVLSQTPLMHVRDAWAFIVYDDLDRPVFSGQYNGAETPGYWRRVIAGTQSPNSHGVPDTETVEYYIRYGFSKTASSYPSSIYNALIQSYNYYDNYNFSPTNLVSFFGNDSVDYLFSTGVEKPKPYLFVHGKLTGSKVLIPDTTGGSFQDNWIKSVFFYDEKSRLVQTQTKNIWDSTKWDISTTQYNFNGQPVLNISRTYFKSGSDKPFTRILTKNDYSIRTGRLDAVEQKVDTFAWQPIANSTYDELGRISKKWLGNVEEQNYSYNLRGELIGTNADFLWDTSVVNPTMTYWSKLYYDYGFSDERYDGSIAGFMWRSASSKVCSYGYKYDDVGRMNIADYRDFVGNAWKKTVRDFSVSNVSFDENGNMLSMKQRGYNATYGPDDIDDLTYSYDNGNRLQKVTDAGVASPIADFDNGSSGTSTDYTYDADGNLTSDYNKAITELSYNNLDLPLQVKKGADKIDNLYSSSGTLLQKKVTEGGNTSTYNYWGPFVFKNNDLQFFLHSEGRSRWVHDTAFFKNDFFVKDHLGNVRTVVTADIDYSDTNDYHAGFEFVLANVEETIFDNIGTVRELNPSGTPQDLESARLDGCDNNRRIGASILLHAMTGDQLNLHAYGYYNSTDTNQYNTYAPAGEMLDAIISTLSGGSQLGGGESGNTLDNTLINNLLTSTNYNLYNDFKNSITDPNYPRAYLNYLVFDESMNIQVDKCQVVQLKGAPGTWNSLNFSGNMIASTGYALCFLSNESCLDVFMDNEHITHMKGRLLEEQHYYPHGLLVEDGGQQNTPLRNDFLYQTKRLQKELGLELYDFHARQYDPQIGRFWGIDPADQFPSGYTGMGNDPANNIDPSGMTIGGFNGQGAPYGSNFLIGQQRDEAYAKKAREIANALAAMNGGNKMLSQIADYCGSDMAGEQKSTGERMYDAKMAEQARTKSDRAFAEVYKAWQEQKKAAKSVFKGEKDAIKEEFRKKRDGDNLLNVNKDADAKTSEFKDEVTAAMKPETNPDDNGVPSLSERVFQGGGNKNVTGAQLEKLDLNTLQNNWFKTNYIGPNNPKTVGGADSYKPFPVNLADLGAEVHDKAYDAVGARGLGGVLYNTKTIQADKQFVNYQFSVFSMIGINPVVRGEAALSGMAIFILSAPKIYVAPYIQTNGYSHFNPGTGSIMP